MRVHTCVGVCVIVSMCACVYECACECVCLLAGDGRAGCRWPEGEGRAGCSSIDQLTGKAVVTPCLRRGHRAEAQVSMAPPSCPGAPAGESAPPACGGGREGSGCDVAAAGAMPGAGRLPKCPQAVSGPRCCDLWPQALPRPAAGCRPWDRPSVGAIQPLPAAVVASPVASGADVRAGLMQGLCPWSPPLGIGDQISFVLKTSAREAASPDRCSGEGERSIIYFHKSAVLYEN